MNSTQQSNMATSVQIESQYESLCDFCECQLSIDVHIFCLTKSTGEEQTLCVECWEDMKEDWKAEGWVCDEEEDDEEMGECNDED